MNRTLITASLQGILCGLMLAQQSGVPGAPVSGRAGVESGAPGAPVSAGPAGAGSAVQPGGNQPQTAQSAKAAPSRQAASGNKKKRSAAKKKGTNTAIKEQAAPPAPPPVAQTPPPPAAPQLPPTLMNQPPVNPTVTMRNGLLTIDAPNSTLSEVLNGVRQATGAVLEGVSPSDRVAVRLGPGSPRDVVAALLQGTSYNYLILGSDLDPNAVTHILLSQGSSSSEPTPPPQQPAAVIQPPIQLPPEPPELPDQGNAAFSEGEQAPPALPPQPQPVNPNQPWLTMPQQQPGQSQQPPLPAQAQ